MQRINSHRKPPHFFFWKTCFYSSHATALFRPFLSNLSLFNSYCLKTKNKNPPSAREKWWQLLFFWKTFSFYAQTKFVNTQTCHCWRRSSFSVAGKHSKCHSLLPNTGNRWVYFLHCVCLCARPEKKRTSQKKSRSKRKSVPFQFCVCVTLSYT